jgi:hypothetical protein
MAQMEDIDQGAHAFAVHDDQQSCEILWTSCIRSTEEMTVKYDREGCEGEERVWFESLG